jgi:hypothetical protein
MPEAINHDEIYTLLHKHLPDLVTFANTIEQRQT